MKKTLLFLVAFVAMSLSALADEVTITWSASTDWTLDTDSKTATYTQDGYTIYMEIGEGSTTPTVNASQNDARAYANNTVTISTPGDAMTQIVFNVSTNGKKRLTDITSDTGTTTVDGDNYLVTWTGSATSVTFTVGAYATYGTDGSSKAGQLCYDSVVISTDEVSTDSGDTDSGDTDSGDTDSGDTDSGDTDSGDTDTDDTADTTTYTFTKVTSEDDLAAGDVILLVNEDASKALSYQKSNNRHAVDVTIASSTITLASSAIASSSSDQENVYELTLGGTSGAWTFYDPLNEGYLYAASSSSNYLKTQSTSDSNSEAAITFDDGSATILFQGDNTRNWLAYNTSSTLFACYATTSSMVLVQIYKLSGETSDSDSSGDTDTGDTDDEEEETDGTVTLYSEDFDASTGDFTIDNVTIDDALSYIWTTGTYNGTGYAKASGYKSGAYETEGWLISPEIDFTEATELSLSFSQDAAYFGSNDNFLAAVSVRAKAEDDTEWTTLEFDNWPTGTSFDGFVTSTADFSAFDGKKVQIAFVYTSTSETAGTWEVCKLVITGKGTATYESSDDEDEEDTTSAYTTLAELHADATTTQVAVTYTPTNLLVTGVGKRSSSYYVYVTDGTDYAVLYGSNTPICEKGDILTGTLTGNLCIYYNTLEIASVDYSAATVESSGNEVTPEVLTIATLGNDTEASYQSRYIRLENVMFESDALSSSNITLLDDSDNSITLRDNFSVLTDFVFDTTKEYNVNAYVAYYNSVAQLYVCEEDDIELITDLLDPETAWAESEIVVLPGESLTQNTLTTASDGAKTFTSSDESVATVDSEGTVSFVGYGSATITVETAETETYLASKASFTITFIEGAGTFDNPYSPADVQYYVTSDESVWVKGTIIGYISNTSTGAYSEVDESVVSTNLAIGSADCYLSVQLPSGTVREGLNLVDNPELQGQTVWVYGVLAKYCGIPGVKSVTDYSLDGSTTATSIVAVTTSSESATLEIYSLDGRKLSAPQKGINIINGKKVLVK